MSRAGDVNENPITGERAVVRVGTEDSGGDLLVCDVYVRPGGRVAAEHVHPAIEEWFTVVSGRVSFRLGGRETVARLVSDTDRHGEKRNTQGPRRTGDRGSGCLAGG